MKLKLFVAAAVIGFGALTLPGAGQAATVAAPAITAHHSAAIQDIACHWRRVWIHRHRGPHGHWIPGHWSRHRHRVCHH